jgi:WD40 repeat protein
MKTLQGHSGTVSSICFSPDGCFLASGSRDKTIKVWDLQQEKKLKQISVQSDVVHAVCYSPDGRFLASACQDKIIKVWDICQGLEVREFLAGYTDIDVALCI